MTPDCPTVRLSTHDPTSVGLHHMHSPHALHPLCAGDLCHFLATSQLHGAVGAKRPDLQDFESPKQTDKSLQSYQTREHVLTLSPWARFGGAGSRRTAHGARRLALGAHHEGGDPGGLDLHGLLAAELLHHQRHLLGEPRDSSQDLREKKTSLKKHTQKIENTEKKEKDSA